MSEELAQYQAASEEMRLGALRVQSPEAVIQRASEIASALADIIRKRGLALKIRDAEYVKVDGWIAMGAMLGVIPRERETKRLDDGSYEAAVDLVRAADGVVIGGASAVCGVDEKRWAEMPEYARRSMALTRAAGKAFRLAFSWIIALAGYEPTPAEEIVDVPAQPSEPAKKDQKPPDAVTAFWSFVKERGISKTEADAHLKDAGGDFGKALVAVKKLYG